MPASEPPDSSRSLAELEKKFHKFILVKQKFYIVRCKIAASLGHFFAALQRNFHNRHPKEA
jgi:hypothetical protein